MKHCLIVLALAAAAPLHAQDAAPPPDPTRTPESIFERMDRDGSGGVDTEEFRNALTRRFALLDKNADGVLVGDEIPPNNMAAAATDPQRLTEADFQASLPDAMASMDTDKDGLISLDELRVARQGRTR